MRIIDLIRMGLRNLFRRKARTLLTVIGVVIGTVSIVVMISVGIGMNRSFEASVMENGSMTVIDVSSYAYSEDEDGNWTSTQQTLNSETIELLKGIEHVKCVTPIVYCWNAQLYVGKFQNYPSFMVMDMDCYEDFGYPALEDGTYPKKGEEAFYVGSQAMYDFYYWNGRTEQTKTVDLSRDKVELKFNNYQPNPRKKEFSYVIPSFKNIPASESGYSEADYYIFMDFDLYKSLMQKYANTLKIDDRKKCLQGVDKFENIRINVDNMNNVTAVQDEIEKLGFKSTSSMQYIEPMQETAKMLELVLGAIGAVAMLVSAINIANTMIMSIYERTKEIGIMKVLGCKVADIRKLFLFEAGMIGLIGGVVGIMLSYAASWLLNKYGTTIFESLMSGSVGVAEGANFSVIPLWLPLFGAAFAMLVGLLSGFLPAVKATRISAIEAMKAAE